MNLVSDLKVHILSIVDFLGKIKIPDPRAWGRQLLTMGLGNGPIKETDVTEGDDVPAFLALGRQQLSWLLDRH